MLGMVFLLTCAAFIGGTTFRIRGGMFMDGGPHIIARGSWAIGMGAVIAISTGDLVASIASIPFFYAGTLIGWFTSLDLDTPEDYFFMLLRGLIFTLPALVPLLFFGLFWPVAFAGLICPLMYHLAYLIPSHFKDLRSGPELGEALFGAAVAMIFMGLLHG